MKIAIISDIHGNMQALQSVLEDIKEQKCEKVFCLGDIALAGPQPRMAIETVMKHSEWSVIQGNTDELIAHFSPEIFNMVKAQFPIMADALADDVILIEDHYKEFLKNLPKQKELEIEGVKILLVHGSPRKNNENILPDLPIKQVEEMLEGTTADVVFCGHTHIPCGYQTSKRQTVVNVGSVGRPMGEPKACYVIADFEDGGFSVEHRHIEYDNELAAGLLRQRDFKGAKEVAALLINPTQRHV